MKYLIVIFLLGALAIFVPAWVLMCVPQHAQWLTLCICQALGMMVSALAFYWCVY